VAKAANSRRWSQYLDEENQRLLDRLKRKRKIKNGMARDSRRRNRRQQ